MMNRPFSTQYFYNLLELKQGGNTVDRIGSTLFNSKIRLTPHQIEAALFAFKSPLSKGAVLADEVGLGKTIEAGIVLAQLWSEHKRKILIVTPASLMRQWGNELLEKFNLPSIILDRKTYNKRLKEGHPNPFVCRDKIIICSYQMCCVSEADIKMVGFDLCIIDEAHKLRNVWTEKNVISLGIKRALTGTKKLLLTATPIQNNVMDLYGLTSLIDENVFGDAQIYKEKYVKDYSINVDDLKDRLSSFVHRTLREQVKPYIKFTKRIPKTFNFKQSEDEKRVYEDIRELLLNSGEESYLIPKKEKHLLLLILCKLMGSSIHSIVFTLEAMRDRLKKLLETGIDDGIDFIIEDSLVDEEDEYSTEYVSESRKIDVVKLKQEISNLERIIFNARRISVESKYIALKEAIDYGFSQLEKTGANKKILIFTESKRTQDYLYQSLISDGFDEVLVFNGSNSDQKTQEIYQEWCNKPENLEKLRNSKGVNVRQAIIDYFEEKGKILIATEAGAEGLNMQFCSMVVNYDLPWNPQLVEQRIGRCHRFGQQHDVVVINFLSTSNAIEQRIYELLSSKFRVFNEIFGSSDSILGSLEDGVALQNAIIDIYTKCRTTEEINAAFDSLQEQYKEVIDASLKKTKKDLLDNFDEDLQNYFADVMNKANESVGKIERVFWSLTKNILTTATYDDSNYSFVYKGDRYCLSTKNNLKLIDYNMGSILGQKVLNEASQIHEDNGHIDFDITNYPYRITNVEELKGKEGFIIFNKLTINTFEKKEFVFFNACLSDGTPIPEDTVEKLFRLSTTESSRFNGNLTIVNRLKEDALLHSKKIRVEEEERSNVLLNAEIEKINKWADDKIESTQLAVELLRNERKNLQKQADLAESTFEREKIEEEILKLSKRIKTSWLRLADAEEEIEEQRKSMIKKLRAQMMTTSSTKHIFIVSFKVI